MRGTSRIPSLDGLRAISIGFVILFHLGGAKIAGGALPGIGNLGVRIFFVISGYLITSLLLSEQDSTGRISLRNFYARRALRIFPAFYTFLIVIACCGAAGLVELHPRDLLQSATYTANYFPGPRQSPWIRHIWSLSVEEQFYLLWPGVLYVAGRRFGMRVAAAFLLAAPVIRLIYYFWFPGLHDTLDRRFETVADALATGCLLAGWQPRMAASDVYNRMLRSKLFYLVPVLVVACAAILPPRPRTFLGFAITFMNLGIALCIDRWVRFPAGAAGALLNSVPFRTVGLLSYSIYLWQQPFLDPEGTLPFQRFPINVVLAAAFSLASFYAVEQPVGRLRARFAQRRAAGVAA